MTESRITCCHHPYREQLWCDSCVEVLEVYAREETLKELLPQRAPVDKSSGGHINKNGKFQSDKYEWCPEGFLPVKVTDPMAKDLLMEYAVRRGQIDIGFKQDLLKILNEDNI